MTVAKKQIITSLGDDYEMSQREVAEKMFLNDKTIATTEKKAIEKFKKALSDRNINLKDLL